MSDWQLNEPIIAAVTRNLTDYLPAELTAIRSGLTDEEQTALPDPAQVYDFVPPPGLLTAFPVVAVEDSSTEFEDDTGSSATGVHQLGIVCFLVNPDQRLLAFGLRRYLQAIMRTILRTDRKDPNGAYWAVNPRGLSYGPTLENEENPRTYMSWAVARFEFKREEL